MQNIFLDIGSNLGQSLQRFSKEYSDFTFYCFEPNPTLIPSVLNVMQSVNAPCFLYPGAAWTTDGFIDLFLGSPQGSTVMAGKRENWAGVLPIDYTRPVRVPAIDISAMILRLVRPGDRLVVKMDIEGGEFEVVPKMLADGAMGLIERFYCEWHEDRFPNLPRGTQWRLKNQCREVTILEDWD